MTDARFDELLQQLLDRELATSAAAEFAAELHAHPARTREVRRHLVLWELWAQLQAAERNADAFTAACRTRLLATRDGDEFLHDLTERLEAAPRLESIARRLAAAAASLLRASRPRGRPFAILGTAAAAAMIVLALWFGSAQPARATAVITGEAVCTACFLHETHEHLPAIRVPGPAGRNVYYVQSDPRAVRRLGDYCLAPVPLVATGETSIRDGRHTINIRHLEHGRPASLPSDRAEQRVLFPF